MNVKKTIKKIAALGAGVTMVGATVMGAMAYDLANYPAPFVADGVFDGVIVLGSSGAMEDMLGAVDIAASLQADAVTTEAVNIPGQAGEVSLEGDSVKVETSNDMLELREPIGDVLDTITEDDLVGLKSGHISTSEGDTDYFQYLRLKDGTSLQDMTVNYVVDQSTGDDVMADYLVVKTDDTPFMEWEIQFPEGFESAVESDGALDDYDDKTFNILGKDFSVVSANYDTATDQFEMTLMGGSLSDTLREGETKTYTLNGVEYEVTLVFVSDPQSGGSSSTTEAKFWVNGEVTPAMSESETEVVGGIQLGVRDILANARDGIASFFLGADKVEFTDTNATDSDVDGTVEVNQESIGEADVGVLGSYDTAAETFEVTSIKYQLAMDASDSYAYVPAGHAISEFMRRPEARINDGLDIRYEGLTEVDRSDFEVKLSSDDKYKLVFTNLDGQEYTVPYVSHDGGVWKFGDDDDELVFVEDAATWYNIGEDDYFVVSNDRSDTYKSITNVLRYDDYDDNTRTVEFKDVGTGNVHKVTVSDMNSNATGDLVVGGHTYNIWVNQTADINSPIIAVDLDGDGSVTTNDRVMLTTWGGLVVDMADLLYLNTSNKSQSTDADGVLTTYDGNGLTFSNAYVDNDEYMQIGLYAYIDSSLFDTTGEENFTFTVYPAKDGSNWEVDLSFSDADYYGPLTDESSSEEYLEFQFQESEDDSDVYLGMTDYGILVERDQPSNDPASLKLGVPEQQVGAQVFVTLGDVTAVAGGAGSVETDVVNPIAVGLAVLDTAAPSVGASNMIVVGGPCVNSVAAELLGYPEPCEQGFMSGKGLIKSFEQSGKVAILVAGMDAQDTQGASRVLSDYADYALDGSEVEVVVASLNDLTVQEVTAMDDGAGDDAGDDMGNETNTTA